MFSLAVTIDKGFDIIVKEKDKILLCQGSFQLVFDEVIQSPNGCVLGAEVASRGTEMGCLSITKEKSLKGLKLYEKLGHYGEEKVCVTGKMMKWYFTRNHCQSK